jgi:hypothetical protein
VRRVQKWTDLKVGQTIVYRGTMRDFTYRVEEKFFKEKAIAVSIHRPPRKRREFTYLMSIPSEIQAGRLFIKRGVR